MTEKILRVNNQKSGNGLLIDTCNSFRDMNCPTIQPITLTEEGKIAYRSKGGLVGIYTEKVLDEVIAGLESLRAHVRKYEASAKEEEASAKKVDDKTIEKALKTLISIGHSEAEARKILKLDQQKDKEDDLPEDLRITLQVLLDKGIPRQEAYKRLGLTKAGKIDKRKKR